MKVVSWAGKPSNVFLAVVLVSSLPALAGSNAAAPSVGVTGTKPLHVYKSLIPLGSEVFAYSHHSQRETFYAMASASNREFEGQALCADGARHVLKKGDGDLVQQYPREVHFRVSVSERAGFAPIDPPFPIDSHESTF